jgi:hypothetical protein
MEGVWKLICTPKNLKHRLVLMTTYSAGLRASEVISLKPEHIDSKRMLIKVEGGKGGKDRYILLSFKLLAELRQYYRKYHPHFYLFPSSYKERKHSPPRSAMFLWHTLLYNCGNEQFPGELITIITIFQPLPEYLVFTIYKHSGVIITLPYDEVLVVRTVVGNSWIIGIVVGIT